jgi:uncharacterized protein (DUF3084 family)
MSQLSHQQCADAALFYAFTAKTYQEQLAQQQQQMQLLGGHVQQMQEQITKAEQDKQAALDEAGALRNAVAELEAEVATLKARLTPPPAPDQYQPADALIVGTEETVD